MVRRRDRTVAFENTSLHAGTRGFEAFPAAPRLWRSRSFSTDDGKAAPKRRSLPQGDAGPAKDSFAGDAA
jgi:hypothetical protein